MRLIAFLLVLALPVEALALSCLRPTVDGSFARYDASAETYVVVHGRLTLNESKLPDGMTQDPPPPALTRVPARLRGTVLSKDGFLLPFQQKLTLEVACLGPWCGGAKNGSDVLAFIRKDEDGYAIEVSPCGGAIFSEPDKEMLQQAQQCLLTRACEEN